MKLVISLATRGRPQQLLATVARSVANLACSNTDFVVQIDADDEPTVRVAGALEAIDARVKACIRPREDTIAAKWNRALKVPGDLYLVAADDDPYVTPDYDARLLAAADRFPDGIGMVYGHMANASFSGVVAPTRRLCDKLGHIFPEFFPYWFVDHWTDDVARMIGRISFADVRTDQSGAGKTQEMREPAWWATWFDAAYLMRRRIAHEIIEDADFVCTRWQRDVLLAQYPLIEYRSRWINDNVRANARHLEQWSALSPGNARYQRVKAAAQAMVPHMLAEIEAEHEGWNWRWSAAQFRDALIPPASVPALKRAFA